MATIIGKNSGGLVQGGALDDSVRGLAGSDIVRGRAGDDVLTGGAGNDVFFFERSRGINGFDTIRDYRWSTGCCPERDVLDLSAVLDRVGGSDSSRETIHRYVWLIEGAAGAYLYIDRDGTGGSGVAQTWALLEGVGTGDLVRVRLAYGPEYLLTVRQGPMLSYSPTVFTEVAANDGSIATLCTITLTLDTFTGNDDEAIAGAVVTHVPAGLSASVIRTSATTATLSLTGNAAAHLDADDIANLTVTFGDAAFTTVAAAHVDGSTKSDLAVDFADQPAITYSANAVAEAAVNDGSIVETLTITLEGDTFTGTDGAVLAGAVVTHVPDGLTAVVTRTGTTTAELSFTGNARHHLDADDIANLTVTFGDSAFTTVAAAHVDGSTRDDLAIDFDNPDPLTVVVFDFVDGWSSNHSGRDFQSDTSYTIFIRVDSHALDLVTAPGAGAPARADWGEWTGADQLGTDDKVVLVGNDPDSEIIGYLFGPLTALSGFQSWVYWSNRTLTTYPALLWPTGLFRRAYDHASTTLRIWTSNGTWAGTHITAQVRLSDCYARVIPVGILTSQAALIP